MGDAGQLGAVVAGAVGLVAFAGGSLVVAAPPVDRPVGEVVADLRSRRSQVLIGSVASLAGVALLLWPLAVVATTSGSDGWPSLAVASLAAWVLGFGFLSLASLALVAVVWRHDSSGPSGESEVDGGAVGAEGDEGAGPGPEVCRLLLDVAHLAVWSVSAPVGALSTVATTVVGLQADVFGGWGPLLAVAAALKVATVLVELAGLGRRTGWNAGGWALGLSGYVTVAWFALLLAALA